ncbi:MMPL family transporter [Luminiphilus sp. nBUS_07]|uniref:MMPL family transporter n=1 Tax=Luminiphilus sp. nBUS_07 TaxID=3395314 RepID=UPI003EBA6474
MRLLEAWVTRCFANPTVTLLLLLGVTVLAGAFGANQFRLNSSMDEVILPRDSEHWFSDDEALKTDFPQLRNLTIIVVAGAEAAQVSEAVDTVLAAAPDFVELDQIATPMRQPAIRNALAFYLDRPDFLALIDGVQPLVTLSTALQGEGALTGALGVLGVTLPNETPPALLDLLQGKATTLKNLDLVKNAVPAMLSPYDDLFYELILVSDKPNFDAQFPGAEIVQNIEKWIAPVVAAHPALTIALTGDIVLAHEEISDALAGVKLAAGLSTVFLILVLALGVRSGVLTAGMLLLVVIGSLWTHALAMITVGQYNTLSLAFLVMFFGLGVDFGLHYGLAVREVRAESNAVASAVRNTGVALMLSAATTAWAFLSFMPTEYKGLGELGIISAGGMLVAIFLTVTLLPALFGLLGLPGSLPSRVRPLKLRWPSMQLTLAIWLVLGVTATLKARDAHFDYSVAGLRDLETPAMTLLDRLQRGGFSTDYSISTMALPDELPGLKAQLAQLEAVGYVRSIEDYLPQSDHKDRVLALTQLREALDLVSEFPALEPQVVRAQLAALSTMPTLPAEILNLISTLQGYDDAQLIALDGDIREAISQWRKDLEPLLTSEPPQISDLSQQLQRRWILPDGRHRLEFGPATPTQSREGLNTFVSAANTVVDNGGGRAVIEYGVGSVVVRAFQQASILAVLGIALMLMLYYRNLIMPMVVIVPLMLTTVLTFAVMEWVGLSLNMANVLVVPLIFGLGIDSAIHIAHRYQTLGSVERLMQSSTPRAVMLSAVTTVATFASLMTSTHRGAASLGQLLTIAIPIMVVVTFSLVPVLMTYFGRFTDRPLHN